MRVSVNRSILAAFLGGAFALLSANPGSAQESELKTNKDRVSYSVGAKFAEVLKDGKHLLDIDVVLKTLRGLYEGGKPLLTRTEIDRIFSEFQREMVGKMSGEAQAKGKAMLEENAKKEGVTVLPSGLQYKVLASGSGATPTRADTVKTHYRGTLADGTEFDSSYARGEPASFPVGRVIAGWTEALQLMKEGDKWELYIPPELAYGARGSPPRIPPNSTLIFEIELIEIMK